MLAQLDTTYAVKGQGQLDYSDSSLYFEYF